jgi:proline iminopeptidase
VNQAIQQADTLLDVGDGHRIFVEEVGAGIPAIFLHGGPGSGCRPEQHQLFDRDRHRALFFDQRGAGRSRPSRSLTANTTADLIGDIEKIRTDRGIDRWLVVGGSWGATLALAYAERHPERVAGMVLRSVFLGTRGELDWAFLEAPRRFHPGLLEDFLSIVPDDERGDPLAAYWRRILDTDHEDHERASWAWHDTERVLSETAPRQTRLDLAHPPRETTPSTPLFEAHYFGNDCFLRPNQLLDDAGRLAGIPATIIQGQFDLLCPPSTSASLAAAWPDCSVVVVPKAGHAMSEPGIFEAMTIAIDDITTRARF